MGTGLMFLASFYMKEIENSWNSKRGLDDDLV